MMQTLTSLLLTGAAVAAPSALRGPQLLEEKVLHPSLNVLEIGDVGSASHEMLPGGDYDGMMFAGGMKINGTSTWVARVCTGGCKSVPFDSKVIMGQVKNDKAQWTWTSGAVVPVQHSDKGTCTGPEDPRLDAVEGKRFFLANVNVDQPSSHCPVVRRQVFVPVDSHAGAQQCVIEVDEQNFNECQDQKNWVPLVPKGSKTPFLVYSLVPFQVMSLDRQSCKARMLKSGGVRKPDLQQVRSSTRYVHGLDVQEGAIYWSVGHTPPMEYESVLTAVLAKHNGQTFDFELLGTSCGFSIPGMLTQDQLFSYPNGILDYNADADLADVTFHVDDSLNKVATLRGIKVWLQKAYHLWKAGGSFRCGELISRHLSANSTNSSNTTTSTTMMTTSTTTTMAATTTTTTAATTTTTTTTTTAATTTTTTAATTTTTTTTTTAATTTTTTAATTTTTTASTVQSVVKVTGSATLKVENGTAFCADASATQGFQNAIASKMNVAATAVQADCEVSYPSSGRRLQEETVVFTYTVTLYVDASEASASVQAITSQIEALTPAALAEAIQEQIKLIDPSATYTVEVTELAVPVVETTGPDGQPVVYTTTTTTAGEGDSDTTTTEDQGSKPEDSSAFTSQRLPAVAGFLTAALVLCSA